ncbi:MAG: bifunctional diaminohydroxyphosphoribosylaminopyrimidine deaminase/5-amino-6-(5-phosphoribosylamino)uracil reductase RibD [Phycisphaerae bacterium]|nr:bifunctional diaminohydroxyphosphoribosylaminopyrimidine deaminase/5-amino-6-(5-phosphoribosylamino)uracil reductase RibD [Phycisphaerae bacterium]
MDDTKHMQAALTLAAKGEGFVEPNPMVGCVIVKGGQVIGKGYHEKFGLTHAEINALADCRGNGNDPAGATMYVTLEPCSHHGKTPPCADAVIESKVSEVVIAAVDATEKVAGKGIERIRQAGITVRTGVCEKQARALNPGFYKLAETGRPWVILKWAQSADGYLAYKDAAKHGQWISNEASRKDANFHRRSVQAILVGANTVKQDDPMLTIRPDSDRQPLRIVLDSKLSIPIDSKILDTHIADTLIVTTEKANHEKVTEIQSKGSEVLIVKDVGGKCDLSEVLKELGKRNIQQLLVEGGPKVLDSFIAENLADAVRIYKAPEKLGDLGASPITVEMSTIIKNNLTEVISKDIEGDKRIIGLINKAKRSI